jgi:organic hydroperoxide reductase OsmC/OhrA
VSAIKDHRFGVAAARLAPHSLRLTAAGKPPLQVATPAGFRGGIPGLWSPEDLLVAAVASCFALTLDSVARARTLNLGDVAIEATGHVTRRAEGRLGFVVVELLVDLTVEGGAEAEAESAARDAHRACLVAHALDVPVELELRVRAAKPERLVCADDVTAMLAAR